MANLVLSTTEQQVIPENMHRKSLLFINTDSAINIFLKYEEPGATTVSSSIFDVRLQPGDNFAVNTQEDGDQVVQGRWTAIAASGTPSLVVFETENIRR